MKKVFAYDFDGTLTTRDTLLEFIRYARGPWTMLFGFLLYSPWLVAMKLGLYPNWKAKQRIFALFFRGMSVDSFNGLCQSFAANSRSLLRPNGLASLRDALAENAEVIIISASIENWVRPFFAFNTMQRRMSDTCQTIMQSACQHQNSTMQTTPNIHFACTKIEEINGKISGHFLTNNCYGPEKVKRLLAVFPERESYHLTAFGDSRGDRELLAFADEPHFKPFRRNEERR